MNLNQREEPFHSLSIGYKNYIVFFATVPRDKI